MSGNSGIPSHFRFDARPVANPPAVVARGSYRFTVLASRVIRVEYSPSGVFEDRPSLAVWYRDAEPPSFTVTDRDGVLELKTEALSLRCLIDSPPSGESLTVELEGGVRWRYGDADPANLGGTIRTLDGVDGPVPLQAGLLSRSGWSVLDDSGSPVFDSESWPVARDAAPGAVDLYFFGFGTAYAECLAAYTTIAGRVPLPPRFVLGNWWSRYHEYDDAELRSLLASFRDHGIPLSVCVIDMDWHIVENAYTNGWTGFSWNRTLLPDPAGLLSAIHAEGVRVTLNLHPHAGIHAHEDAYPAAARALGIDPASTEPVPFDITDPRFARLYFEEVLRPLERDGVDFWWMDWQQGDATAVSGLDPLWMLNHLHFLDFARPELDGRVRPLVFSRWAGAGNHRYPIGFSGDTIVSWRSLAFQPYMTATAGNTLCGWWSHDIGGHFYGAEDPELYVRWVQFGVFNPVLRLHTSKTAFTDRRPWVYGNDVLERVRDALVMRHRLIPYLYTAGHAFSEAHVPPVRPMYFENPHAPEAYAASEQFVFGRDLVVAPFTEPINPSTGMSRSVVWLPPGEWFHFATGERFEGGRLHAVYGGLDATPVFAPAGAIVPLDANPNRNDPTVPESLELKIFPGRDGSYALYEDDGATRAYEHGEFSTTVIETRAEMRAETRGLTATIHPPDGSTAHLPATRRWSLVVYGTAAGATARLDSAREESSGDISLSVAYDADTETTTVSGIDGPVERRVVVTIENPTGTLFSSRDRKSETIDAMLHAFHLPVVAKNTAAEVVAAAAADPSGMYRVASFLEPDQMRALCEVAFDAGVHRVTTNAEHDTVIVWNAKRRDDVKFVFASHRRGGLRLDGAAPKSAAVDVTGTHAARVRGSAAAPSGEYGIGKNEFFWYSLHYANAFCVRGEKFGHEQYRERPRSSTQTPNHA